MTGLKLNSGLSLVVFVFEAGQIVFINLKIKDKMEKNVVRQITVHKILGEMLKENSELYEKILDSNISFYFNEIANLAMMDSFSETEESKKTVQQIMNSYFDIPKNKRRCTQGFSETDDEMRNRIFIDAFKIAGGQKQIQ